MTLLKESLYDHSRVAHDTSTPRHRFGHAAPRGRANRRVFFAVACLAFLTRVSVLGVNLHRDEPRFLVPDSHTYIKTAASLETRGGVVDDAGKATWGRVPAYPALLALLFATGAASPERLEGAVFLQCLLGAGLVLIAARSAHVLPGGGGIWPLGLLLSVEPSLIAYSNLILSEIPYALVLLLAFIAWNRYQTRKDTGSLLGLAVAVGLLPLIRPIGVYFPLILLLLLLAREGWSRAQARRLVLFTIIAITPAIAWSWRNYAELGSFTLHSTGSWAQAIFAHDVNGLIGRADLSQPDGILQPWEAGFGTDQGFSPREILSLQSGFFRDTVAAHPLAAARLWTVNALLILGVPDNRLAAILLENPPVVPEGQIVARLLWVARLGPLAAQVVLGMAISLGGLASIPWILARWRLWDPRMRSALEFVLLAVLYHAALSSFVTQQAERYRVPVIPFLAMLFVCGLGLLTRRAAFEARADLPAIQESPIPRG